MMEMETQRIDTTNTNNKTTSIAPSSATTTPTESLMVVQSLPFLNKYLESLEVNGHGAGLDSLEKGTCPTIPERRKSNSSGGSSSSSSAISMLANASTAVSADDFLPAPPLSASSSTSTSSAVAPLRGRPAVDVIATYMNTCDARTMKSELMRAHLNPTSPHSSGSRVRTSSHLSSKDVGASQEWGWFADIDSSGESFGCETPLATIRRRLSSDFGNLDHANSLHVLCDEQANSRISASHKTFSVVSEGKSKVVSACISIPKFRIVQARSGADRHAQYLITFKLGKELYADWRRYSEFGELSKKLETEKYSRTLLAWKKIDTRWFNRLEPAYLHQKCITLENFMRELMYESNETTVLLDFLGGNSSIVNTKPGDSNLYRPSAQLPKELRPPQPRHERELFEKMWAENFKRSSVNYVNYTPTQKA